MTSRRVAAAWLLIGCATPPPPMLEATDAEVRSLHLVQLDLRGSIGESMLIVGPDGTAVLIDVGNDVHAAAVAAKVRRHTGRAAVDAVLVTHYHADHLGGLGPELSAELEIGGIVTRGEVGLDGPGANRAELAEAARVPAWSDQVALCTPAACALPWRLDLGDGAEIVVFGADGRAVDPDGTWVDVGALPSNDDGENARSLVGIVRYGAFSFLFGGDLTGGGKDTPRVEQAFAAAVAAWLPDGASLLHLNHHGISSSTSPAWVAAALPGRRPGRYGIVGANVGYLDAPSEEAFDALRGRVDRVWGPGVGLIGGSDPLMQVVRTDVVVRVTPDDPVPQRVDQYSD